MARLRRSAKTFGLLAASVLATFPAIASETVNYAYDSRGRLIQVSRSGTINNGVSACYAYDRGDNRRNVTSATSECATFSVSASNVSAPEGSPLNFTVNKVGGAQTAFSVNYATSNGTATAGSDYTAASGTLNFAAGETQKTVVVATTHDLVLEPDETVIFTLSSPSGGATIADTQATGAILNNDSLSFSVNDPTATEGPGATITFTVTKAGSTGSNASVNYMTVNGSATAGADYNIVVGTLVFGPSETSKPVVVTLLDNTVKEPTEVFFLNLSAPTGGASISDAQGMGTINDND